MSKIFANGHFAVALSFTGHAQRVISMWNVQDRVSPTGVVTGLDASAVTISAGTIAYQNSTDDGGIRIGNPAIRPTSNFDVAGKYLVFFDVAESGYLLELTDGPLDGSGSAVGPFEDTAATNVARFYRIEATIAP